jgi:predicted transglutaminase-like cysteine proteinase
MRGDTTQDNVGKRLAFVEPVSPPVPIQDAPEPFGLGVITAIGEIPDKWRDVEVDIRGDMDILARCRADAQGCPAEARRFLAIVDEGRARDGRARIGVINRAINLAIRPMSDFAQWGVVDRWSSPLETFFTGRGDCEDYAIAKYIALVEAGVAEGDVKLLIERDLTTNQDHAVVATRLNGEWIVLDNRSFALAQDVELRQVVPPRRMVPLFVMDHGNVKQFASNKGDQNIAILADNLKVAPAAIPWVSKPPRLELVAKELSNRRSREWSAFIDGLTNSVDSGNLLVRRLTIAEMHDYAMRTYQLAVDNSGN